MLARISGCRGVVGFKVATSLRPVREVFRPAWLGVCVSAKKFVQRAENTPKLVFLGLLGELCRGLNRGEGCAGRIMSRIPAPRPGITGDVVPDMQERVALLYNMKPSGGVSEPHVVQFPQSGGGEVGTRGGAALTVRTASEKSAEYGLLWATWSALWAHRGLS